MRAVQGMVMTQAMTICWATPQRTALTRLAVPTPMMEPDTTWVVLTGRCSMVAVKMTMEEFRSAAKPEIGSSLKILPPTVLMMRQPPIAVPQAMAVAARERFGPISLLVSNAGIAGQMLIQDVGEVAWQRYFDVNVKGFKNCVPWEKAIMAAATICIFLNLWFTFEGLALPKMR